MAEVKLTVLGEDKSGPARQGLLATEKALGMVKAAAAAVGISFGAMMVVNYARDAMLLAARYETLGVTMNVVGNNAGYTGEQMRGFQASLQATGIAMIEARQNLTQMASAQIDLSKSAQLARIAQDAAVIGGINSSEAFSRMVNGIQTAQVEVLRTIGINVNFEDSYAKLAKQLGKSAASLTELEKTQARTNAVVEKGKDIAGAYEAAMGTAGKQINSMKRYLDDLKVKVGEVFQDALTVAVGWATDSLKGLNKEAEDLAKKNQLDQWGRDALMALAFVADGVQGIVLLVRTLTESLIWSGKTLYGWAGIASNALSLNFSNVGDWWTWMNKNSADYAASMSKTFGNVTSFQDQAKGYLQVKDAAAANLAAVKALEETRMKAGAASRSDKTDNELLQVQKTVFKELAGNLDKYSKSLSELGRTQLDFAGSGFTEDLRRQAELFREHGVLTNGLAAPLQNYLTVIDGVYSVQIAAQQAIGQTLFRIGAEQKVIAQQNVTIATVEKTQATARLQAWSQYLEGLKGMHSAALEGMKRKQQELFEIKMNTGDMVAGLQQKLLSPLEQYYAQAGRLDEKQRLAMTLGSEEKIKLLQAVQGQWASLTAEIKDGDKTLLSQTEAVTAALERVKSIGALLEAEKQTQLSQTRENLATLETAMGTAAAMIAEAQGQIIALDNTIAALSRSFALTMDDKATPVIDRVQAALGEIRDKTITITANYVSSYSGASTADIPQYETGTPYVPFTQLAVVHQGERIITAKENAKGNTGGSGSITISAVNFNLPNVTNSGTADELVNQAFPKLAAKLDEYQRRKRAA